MPSLSFDDIHFDAIESKHKVNVTKVSQNDIAIIGMSVNFPQAANIFAFWNNLRSGKDCMRPIPKERKRDIDNYFRCIGQDPKSFQYEDGAYLDHLDHFDYKFFKLSPKEASLMDPNQRLFLQVAWETIEDAGYAGRLDGTRTGVYVGFGNDADYKKMIADIEPDALSLAVPGNLTSIIGSRISYMLDLKGPSMLVNTACSSSLVAVHLACQAIRNRECEMAIAGGVQLHLQPIRQAKVGIESKDNRTKTFDDSSDGTGGGEGIAAVLLKPLSKAIKDRDNIFAVIKGSAVNQDGSSVGITAPNAVAQEEVIVRAWQEAGIAPQTITYVEAHGSGTKLGDPIEIEGLARAFGRYTDRKQFCAVGSVKSNIGHLDSSAGIAGLVKTVLSLRNKEIPPSLHFNRPNRKIDFEETAVYVNDELTPWTDDLGPRRAGVSSFGMSGTNCHVIVEEFQPEETGTDDGYAQMVLPLSAKDTEDLQALVQGYIRFLQDQPAASLADISFTASTGRVHFGNRLAVVFDSRQDLLAKLTAIQHGGFEKLETTGVFYGEHKVVAVKNQEADFHELTEAEQAVLNQEAQHLIAQHPIDQAEMLEQISRLYVNGATVEWERLYDLDQRRKVSVVTYPFKKKRCWLNLSAKLAELGLEETPHRLYKTEWQQANTDEHGAGAVKNTGHVLVLKDGSRRSDDYVNELREAGFGVVEAELGDGYSKITGNRFTIRNTEADYDKLLLELQLAQVPLTHIAHLLSLSNEKEIQTIDQLRDSQQLGVYSLFHLGRALQKGHADKSLSLILISDYAHQVTGTEERINAESATLFGLTKSLMWECPMIRFRCMDTDDHTDMHHLMKELTSGHTEFMVSFRHNERYIEKVAKADLSAPSDSKVEMEKDGVYMITGGLGRIGREIGKYITSQAQVKLVMVNRTQMPPKDQWQAIADEATDESMTTIIKDLLSIEQSGSTVACYSADITSELQLSSVLEQVRKEHGPLKGIIHSAGVGVGMQGALLKNDDIHIFSKVMEPKVEATWLLDTLTKQDPLDFMVLCSSAITMIGGSGSGSYSAANAYLDAYSDYRNRQGRQTITINWPAWDKDGMIEMAKIDRDKQLFDIISPEDAIAAFHNILSHPQNKTIVGELNDASSIFQLGDLLPFSLSDELKTEIAKKVDPKQKSTAVKANRKLAPVKLTGRKDQNFSEIEKEIATIWGDVLGFEEFSIYDNFFEIGGDSILMTKVHAQIEAKFPGQVKVTDLFGFPNISKLAQFIASNDTAEVPLNENPEAKVEISDLLDQLENGTLSMEQALDLFK
ncbi:type I polyketide synthase [Brevibacillus dissolubilis]|uniref:type I polyketide synthase n=1 Tax=Brevibacillus dissolubilis TaxID=1844116 RepID=UPI001115EB58|nr:type I polyketide synthase [Brevibacillus dissolubilis]